VELPLGYTGVTVSLLNCSFLLQVYSGFYRCLVLIQFLCSTYFNETFFINLWYLDDGTFIESRSSLFLVCISTYESVSCTGFVVIAHILISLIYTIDPIHNGLEFLGSLVWGPPQFYDSFLFSQIDKIFIFLRSSSGTAFTVKLFKCLQEVTHILCCVFSSSLDSFQSCFDFKLQDCFSRIMSSSISDNDWFQATLPFQFDGLGLHDSRHLIFSWFL